MSEKEQLKTLTDILNMSSHDEIMKLYKDSLILDETGVLPMDAPLRVSAAAFFKDNTAMEVLQMLFVSREVYKKMAMTYYNSLTEEI